ncbi:hypothetical protein [Streptomyces fumanus]|uniref:Uncharacterized protein n=1 Tax=Streptomyces fumanus TaxID=67302 RepID=A0A919EBE1_9ACTN|nr:hypothetical protein [Streptomyces fumanus]GHF33311.1 hypothetical protein GCM10018772_68670 [Streptomyces fumanus]
MIVRPGEALKQGATQALNNRGREMQGFVVACLNALVADPDSFLRRLSGHWPAEKPRGRPRKDAHGDAAGDASAT